MIWAIYAGIIAIILMGAIITSSIETKKRNKEDRFLEFL